MLHFPWGVPRSRATRLRHSLFAPHPISRKQETHTKTLRPMSTASTVDPADPPSPPTEAVVDENDTAAAAAPSAKEADVDEYFRLTNQAYKHKKDLEHFMQTYTETYADVKQAAIERAEAPTQGEQDALLDMYNYVIATYNAWGATIEEFMEKDIPVLDMVVVDSDLVKRTLEEHHPHDIASVCARTMALGGVRAEIEELKRTSPEFHQKLLSILTEMVKQWNNGAPEEYDGEPDTDAPENPDEVSEYVVARIECISSDEELVRKNAEFFHSFVEKLEALRQERDDAKNGLSGEKDLPEIVRSSDSGVKVAIESTST